MSRDFYKATALIVLVSLALLLAFRRCGRYSPEESTYVPKKTPLTREIELLRQYVKIDTSNPPGRELEGARFLLSLLASEGVKGELIESAPGRTSVYARIRGSQRGEGLMLLHHIDVVPADARFWKFPPFAGTISNDILYGRGTLDMKAIGLCQVLAFLDVARAGRAPVRDLVLLATADEEKGGRLGVGWLLEHRPDLFEGIRYAITEGGITEMQAEKVSYFAVEISSKQFVRVKLISKSQAELRRARIRLEPLFDPHEPERILPEVREYFRRCAPHRKTYRALLEDIDRSAREGSFWRLPPSYRSLTQNNIFAFGVRREGDHFAMDVVLQNLPDEDPQARLRGFERLVAPLQVEVVSSFGPALSSPLDTPFFKKIALAARQTHGPVDVGPFIFNYGTTDSRFLRAAGIASYGFFPFKVDFFQSQAVHGEDERIRLDWFVEGVSMVRELVRSHCLPADSN